MTPISLASSRVLVAVSSNGARTTDVSSVIRVFGLLISIIVFLAIIRAVWVVACVLTNHNSANVGPVRYARRREQIRSSKIPDLAWPTYWPTQTWADVATVVARESKAWHGQMQSLRQMIGRVPLIFRWILIILEIPLEVASLLVYVFCGTAYAAIALFVGTVLGTVSFVVRVTARSWEKTVLRLRSAEAACHVPDCYAVNPRAVYVCPTCGTRHRDIRPDRYGGLWRRCRCNALLPTTTLRAARRHEARCQQCDAVLAPCSGVIRSVRLAIVGGSSTGKSSWFFAGIGAHIAENVQHFHAEVVGRGDDFEHGFRAVRSRQAPATDHSSLPEGFIVRVGKGRRAIMVHIFDASGAQLSDPAIEDRLAYFYVAHGLVVVVDPMSIPAVARQIRRTAGSLPASAENPEVAYQPMVNRIRDGGIDLARLQVAVVVSKCDLLREAGVEIAADSEGVRDWLRSVGMGNLVNGIEMSFGLVGWFGVVSLGPVPIASPYSAGRVFDWLLQAHGVTSMLERKA